MRQWRDILKAAGIENLRIHDLRRTMGSWQAATGASLPIIGKGLGHSRPETTAIYSRIDIEPVRAAMGTAATAMLAASKPAKKSRPRKAK
jgi:integrase